MGVAVGGIIVYWDDVSAITPGPSFSIESRTCCVDFICSGELELFISLLFGSGAIVIAVFPAISSSECGLVVIMPSFAKKADVADWKCLKQGQKSGKRFRMMIQQIRI